MWHSQLRRLPQSMGRAVELPLLRQLRSTVACHLQLHYGQRLV
jgi:hypothetical protein